MKTKKERIKTGILPEGFDDEWQTSFKFVLSIAIATLFFSFYFVDSGFQEWVNRQIDFIFQDWQLVFAFVSIILLTIGWWFLRGLAVFIMASSVGIKRRLTNSTTNYARYVVITFFISALISHFIYDYDFADIRLWGICILFCFTFTLFVWTIKSVIKHLSERRVTRPSEPPERIKDRFIPQYEDEDEYMYPKWYIFAFLIMLIPIIIFYIYNIFGIMDATIYFFDILNKSIILKVVFVFILLLTIFWKPIVFIFGRILPKISEKVITVVMKKRINYLRLYTAIFIGVMLITKNIPYWDISPTERDIYSTIFGILATVMASYITRRLIMR